MTLDAGAAVTVERFGRPYRWFPVAVSAEAMALAWANQEDAPSGAAVVVDREIRPTGRQGRLWERDPGATLALAAVLRPQLSVEEADILWLVASSAAAEAAEAVAGRAIATSWPDGVVDARDGTEVASIKAEVQLGPGAVRSAVLTLRFDMGLLGLDRERCDELLEAALRLVGHGVDGGPAAVLERYESRCWLLGRRVRIALLPRGERRGVARRVDGRAHLELESATGLVERTSIDRVLEVQVL